MLLTVIFALSQTAAVLPPARTSGPVAMSRAQIRAYNDHPDYVRCQRSLDTGSLVRKTTTCRTNAEWRRVEQASNDDARSAVERSQTTGSTNGT
jgi:hypothetical protein